MKITRQELKNLITAELNSNSILLETPMSLGNLRKEDDDDAPSAAAPSAAPSSGARAARRAHFRGGQESSGSPRETPME